MSHLRIKIKQVSKFVRIQNDCFQKKMNIDHQYRESKRWNESYNLCWAFSSDSFICVLYSTIEIENENFFSSFADFEIINWKISWRFSKFLYVTSFISLIVRIVIIYCTMFKFIHVMQRMFLSSILIFLFESVIIKFIFFQCLFFIAVVRNRTNCVKNSLSILVVSHVSIFMIFKALNSLTLMRKLSTNKT
jgi:hypothetical protein